MVRLIDAVHFREKLLEFRSKAVDKWGEDGTVQITGMIDSIVKKIDDTPTIDPESLRPSGKWVKEPFSSRYLCTNCKSAFPEWIYVYNYCPLCGARMMKEAAANIKQRFWEMMKNETKVD